MVTSAARPDLLQSRDGMFLPPSHCKSHSPNPRIQLRNPSSRRAAMALHLKLKPQTLVNLRSIRPISSSSTTNPPPPPPPPPPDSDGGGENISPPPPSPYSSYFSDIKERLRSPPTPPRRIPENPPPPPPLAGTNPAPAATLEDIRKNLAEYRLRSRSSPHPSSPERPLTAPPTISFQEIFKNNTFNKAGSDGSAERRDGLSFDSIRNSLRRISPQPPGRVGQPSQSPFPFTGFPENLRERPTDTESKLLGQVGKLPDSIFGKELNKEKAMQGDSLKTEFLKMYSYDELGEKLRKLRPEAAAKSGNTWFSLTELNERLAKLRVMEEKEADSMMGGISFRDLRESLVNLKEAGTNKKASMQRMSILTNLGGPATPVFMLKPPQEHLLEKYFHPDHMSSAEKMKLQLKGVRDEFKMSENDCGSARVQVAQLTTKIKHLSSSLHKKDKHSRKGLLEMVQRRKKLLKYLRRTDWDSYSLVLSKLGLRDIPEYKMPDYKT